MYKQLRSKEWLYEEYVVKCRTGIAIAEEIGCNKATVYRALKRLGIEERPHTSKYEKLNDKNWLINAYVNDGRSLNDIAREVGSTPGNIKSHIDVLGVKTRTNKEVAKTGKGVDASNWKGGRRKAGNYTYVYAPDHPQAIKTGYVMEHRLVAEQSIGRLLKPNEVVHHKDGDGQNNKPENLEVLTRSEHVQRHFDAVKELHKAKQYIAELEAKVIELLEAKLEAHDNTI